MPTTTRTITVPKRDGTTKSVETPYTDEQVLTRLEALVTPPPTMGGRRMGTAHRLARSGCACARVDKGRRYGLSEKQAAWVHILGVEAETPPEAPAPAATVTGLRGMIDRAGEQLKFDADVAAAERELADPVWIKTVLKQHTAPERK